MKKIKVLFIGHYREQSGWGRAAREYILALDEAGVDVVCRAVKLNPTQSKPTRRLAQLEAKSTDGCNVCIQNVLPHLLSYNGNFDRNIAIPFIDTSNIKQHSWMKYLKMFEIWSPYRYLSADLYAELGIKSPVVHVPCDPSKYLSNIEPLSLNIDTKSKHVFYSIFDLTKRKNLVGLLQAFHLAFKPHENVVLILKTGKYGKTPEEVRAQVIDMNEKVCQSLKLYSNRDMYKKPFIITEHMTDPQIDQLHKLGDTFVLPSFAEAFCLPAFDAMAFGNTPIVTQGTACDDYVLESEIQQKTNTGFLVEGRPAPVTGMTDTFDDIFTAREIWIEPDILSLVDKMKLAYHSPIISQLNHEAVEAMTQKFSRQAVGWKMKELLLNEL